MTIRNTFTPVRSAAAARSLALTTLALSLSACGMLGSLIESDKVDYRSAKKAAALDVPPDLTQLQADNRYAAQGSGRGVVTASGLTAQPGVATGTSVETIAASTRPNMRVERNGNQRWLVVKQTPEQLWPQIKDFWVASGFSIAAETAAAGVMETDWAQNRAKIPQDGIRNLLGKVFDGLYSTGERDRYRTRLERNPDGSTEIYISHSGAAEVFGGSQKDTLSWTARPNDPGLEAEFLSKLMVRLGSDGTEAKAVLETATLQPLHAKITTVDGVKQVEVDEGFDRAWRRVGLALDRVGFTVEDRDRIKGIYFVRFVDPDAVNKDGFFAKLLSFGSSDEKVKEAQRYRVAVKAAAGASVTMVGVQDKEGKSELSPTADKILNLLNEQLK